MPDLRDVNRLFLDFPVSLVLYLLHHLDQSIDGPFVPTTCMDNKKPCASTHQSSGFSDSSLVLSDPAPDAISQVGAGPIPNVGSLPGVFWL